MVRASKPNVPSKSRLDYLYATEVNALDVAIDAIIDDYVSQTETSTQRIKDVIIEVCKMEGDLDMDDNAITNVGFIEMSGNINFNNVGNISDVVDIVMVGLQTWESTNLTISGGQITTTRSFHAVDTEGAAATDDLTKINGGAAGSLLILKSVNNARDVVVKDGAFIYLAGSVDFTLTNIYDRLLLMGTGSNRFVEIARADNG